MSNSSLKRLIFNFAGDQRGRNLDVATVLNLLSPKGKAILDAGSGENGLTTFVKSADIIGTDIVTSTNKNNEGKFLCADITSLPFADNSFPIIASVDVLEHLPLSARVEAIAELVRVAQSEIVIAFPCGELARKADESFQKKLSKNLKSSPEWLGEHLQNPYPSTESVSSVVNSEAINCGKKVKKIEFFYSENIKITQSLRWAVLKSKFLYIAANSIFGLLLPLIPKPQINNSYRAIVLVQFQ